MVWLTGAGILVTLVVAILTLRANVRANRASAEAAAANAKALDAQIRALEAMAERAASSSAQPGVTWTINRDKHQYDLINKGTETAFAVSIEEVSTTGVPQDLYVFNEGPVDLAPNSALPFTIERSMASPPVTVAAITWRDSNGEEHREQRLIR